MNSTAKNHYVLSQSSFVIKHFQSDKNIPTLVIDLQFRITCHIGRIHFGTLDGTCKSYPKIKIFPVFILLLSHD